MPTNPILLLEMEPEAASDVEPALSHAGYRVTVLADPDEAFRRAGDHDLVIIDVVRGDRSGQEICREIRATPALASIGVLCISQTSEVEERIAFLEVGADDVIGRPFDGRELEARIEALLLRFERSRDLTPAVTAESTTLIRRLRTVACFSPKGGVGTTTIAVNLAASLAKQHPDQVALVDLDFQFGQVATQLNLTPRSTLAVIARDNQAFGEPDVMRSHGERHESGVAVFAAPSTPELTPVLSEDQVQRLLETLNDSYRHVIVDAGSSLSPQILTVLNWADSVVVPVTPEISALKAVHSLMDFLAAQTAAGAKVTLVVNHITAREMLRMRDVESALGAKVALELPYDPVIWTKAGNEGVPVVSGAPRTAPAEQLAKLVAMVIGDEPESVPVATDRRGGLLGGLRRRA